MPESSIKPIAPASTLHSKILQKIAGVKNQVIAHAIGHDEAHVSRITSCERGLRINELDGFLKSIGLAIIECDSLVVSLPADELAALKLLARKGLQ